MDNTNPPLAREAIAEHTFDKNKCLFLRIPIEIQHRVCALFCRHCLGATSPATMIAETAGVPFKTLKALSETCHALNSIAQPLLYHYPAVKIYTPFFKSISCRPDLASNVRVLAKLYESEPKTVMFTPRPHTKEDFTYLRDLARSLCLDSIEDPEFNQCFECINTSGDGDDHGFTKSMARAAFSSLLIAFHFMLLPKLEFAMIDLDDGRFLIRDRLLEDGRLLLPYPYLPKAVSIKPQHFNHLRTIVFRNTFHYNPEDLGLQRVSFLFPAIPSISRLFFQFVRGEKPEGYRDLHPNRPRAELQWLALPHIQEIYFDPCIRPHDPAPLDGIFKMLQLCTDLRKFTFRLKFPDNYNSISFPPQKLSETLLPTKKTLQHLELYCNIAKIPLFREGTLLGHCLKEFSALETLILDEELFCHHWMLDSYHNSCIVDILPDSVSFLTIRMHDKYKTIPDLTRLGQSVAEGGFPRLSRIP